MDWPTYQEYKKCIKEPGNLTKTEDGRVYYERTPYRFKYAQAVIFVLITAAALFLIFSNTDTLDKTSMLELKYLLIINNLVYIPMFYYMFAASFFRYEIALRYLFAGFKRMPDAYMQNKVGKAENDKPSYMDILIDLNYQKMIKRKKQKPRNFIFCAGERVFEEKRRMFYYLSDITGLLVVAVPFIVLIPFFTREKDIILEHGIYLVYLAVIAEAIASLCAYFIFPVIRWRFNKFEKVDIEEVRKASGEEQHE